MGASIRVELHLDDAPAAMPRDVQAGVDGQAMEPGVEPLGVTQHPEVAPGSMSASWTASRASSGSRRMRRAARSSRVPASRASTVKAS